MIKYVDILKAINQKLKNKFPDIKILSESDITERIERPCFFTSLDNIKASDFMTRSIDKDFTVQIHYFSKNRDKNKIENFDMIDSLNELFVENNLLQIKEDFVIELIEDVNIDIVDKVLHYNFDVAFNEDYNRIDNIENMEDINLKFKEA